MVLVAFVMSCSEDLASPTLDRLRQPTGFRLSPESRYAFVSNGNWDRSELGGSVLVLDLRGLDRALESAPTAGDPTRTMPCHAEGARLSCSAEHMIVPAAGLGIGSAVGNLVVDRPSGQGGATRVLTVQRIPAAVVWFDVNMTDEGPVLDCGVGFDGGCDEVHTIVAALDRPEIELPGDPSRIVLDDQGYRFGYVPHLLGGSISLLALDGAAGPELVDVAGDFFRSDPFEDTEYAGGFGVASRPCDLANAPSGSRDCTRPVLYSSQRFFPSVRRFAVAPGLDVVLPGDESSLAVVNPEIVASQPFMADLAFENPEAESPLLVVQTTPAALVRVDTTVDVDGDPGDQVLGTVSLCEQPNLLAIHRPADEEPLALVTCFGEGLLAVVGLSSFRVLRTIALGAGANEIEVDRVTQRAYVVNTRDDSISVVTLDRRDAGFLTEVARIE